MEETFGIRLADHWLFRGSGPLVDVFRMVSFNDGYRFKMHSHRRLELNYVLKGKCLMMLENELVTVEENSCILIFPDSKHDFYVDSRTGVKIIQLEFRFDELLSDDPAMMHESFLAFASDDDKKKGFLKIPHSPEICHCMERIIVENKANPGDRDLLIRLYFLELWILAERQITKLQQKNQFSNSPKLSEAISIIQSRFSSPLTIDGIASECGVSSRYLRQLFQTLLDIGPLEYLNNLRLQKSKEYLLQRSHAIQDIAFLVGYNSPQYFCRIFKQHHGISPQKYRRLLWEE